MSGEPGRFVVEVGEGAGAARLSVAVGPVRAYLDQLAAAGYPPSLSLAVVVDGSVALRAFGGYACTVGEMVPTTGATSYDLASLTKVVATVTLLLLGRQRGALDLDQPVQDWLAGFPQPHTTLMHLVTHTSGLVDHRPFYATCSGRPEVQAAVLAEAVGTTPGGPVVYSDLNFMLLGWVLEACLGCSLDQAFATQVAEPLAMTGTGFCPQGSARRATAATELDGDQRMGPGLVWGDVHDGNAYALGGVAGHAGLFSPLADMALFVQSLLPGGSGGVLGPEALSLMTSRQAATGSDVRGIGWRLGPQGWGDWPEGTYWHTGFTGTSLLVAPAAGAAVVLLSNGVHPYRRPDAQAAVRATLHQVLAEALG